MEVVFEKTLTTSEKERHWVIIPRRSRKHFPARDALFEIKIDDRLEQTYIDAYNRLRLGARIFDKLGLEEPGCSIVIKKEAKGTYVLKMKEG